jgi:hypothetical protein
MNQPWTTGFLPHLEFQGCPKEGGPVSPSSDPFNSDGWFLATFSIPGVSHDFLHSISAYK